MIKKNIKRAFVIFLILITTLTITASASTSVDMNDPCIVIHAGEFPRQRW